MLVISIDTSGRNGSVALCRGTIDTFQTLQLVPLDGGTYSARLMPAIADLLREHSFYNSDLDGFVVVSGPGSFTGLRVGLATVKGLCEVLAKPLAAVSMLEVLALTYGHDSVTTVLDAGRGEVYVGDYDVTENQATLVREYIMKLAEFPAAATFGPALITPDKTVAKSLESAGFTVSQVAPVQADGIARLGLLKLVTGDVADPATIDVNYIRRSDAEIFSPPKR